MFEDEIALGRAEDLSGKRFGKLVVLYRSKNIGKDVAWKCQCDCGNITYIRASSLKHRRTKSCGCTHSLDITNKRFGKLVALEPTDKRSHGTIVWKCQCDCGNIAYVSIGSLTSGNTKSCGCLISRGEEVIKKLLALNNINFDNQHTFETCRFPKTNALVRFDFYINDSYLLEYDGSQHFFYSGSGWNTEENFIAIQQRDEYKNQWCKENNIPLIRIPYTKLDTLCIEDLLLATTQFRIV